MSKEEIGSGCGEDVEGRSAQDEAAKTETDASKTTQNEAGEGDSSEMEVVTTEESATDKPDCASSTTTTNDKPTREASITNEPDTSSPIEPDEAMSINTSNDSRRTEDDISSTTTSASTITTTTPVAVTTTSAVTSSATTEDTIDARNSSSNSSCSGSKPTEEKVSFKAIYNSKKYDVELPLTSTILMLKEYLSPVIGVMPSMQKIMIKGLAADDKTLSELAVTRTSKVLVVGSKLDDVVNVDMPKAGQAGGSEASAGTSSIKKEPLCTQKQHKKYIDKGLPSDAHPGVKNKKESLPQHPISGMVNKFGGKVRLTFKLELDQVWIGTKQRTEKINMSSIRTVVSEPIEEHEQYHIMGLQLGPTEASRYWLYWVPAQYVDAIKSTVLGSSW